MWYAPDEADLFPDRQWVNMPDEEQGGQGEAEGQEEREEEARAEREMQEDMILGAEGRGAPGGGGGAEVADRTTWNRAGVADSIGSCKEEAGDADSGGEEEE